MTTEPEPPVENKKHHVFDDPRNIKRLVRILLGLCMLVFGADLIFHRHLSFTEGLFPTEGWPGFYASYGFVACVLLVLVAKQMRKVLMRGEDYYGR